VLEQLYLLFLEKSIVQLRFLWIVCPWLRPQLARILCLFSEETLREEQYKVMEHFLNTEDFGNIQLLTNLLLFDSTELLNDDVTVALYNALYQFHPDTIYPTMYTPELHYLPVEEDSFLKFMIECFFKNSLCFKEMQPFSTIALHHRIYGVFALSMMWKRLENDRSSQEDDSNDQEGRTGGAAIIFNALDALVESMDKADGLKDYEIFLLSALSELFSLCNNINPNFPLIRCLIKAGLYDEAWFYLKYYADL
jgi:hypothetical protein